MNSRVMGMRRLAWIPLVAVACVLWAGCGDDGTGRRENLPPTAELTTSPVEGDTLDYRLRAFWTGSDPDGYIAWYEYAVDPPSVFTEAEIADPEGSPGVQTSVLNGSGDEIGRLRVSKTVDGADYSFDWVRTLAFNHEFAFSASGADSVEGDFGREPTGLFYGVHRLYMRAVDDGGAVSPPDKVAFTAETLAPEAEITGPDMGESAYRMTGLDVTVNWDGADPDGGGAKPVGYFYRVKKLENRIWIVQPGPGYLFTPPDSESVWTYRPADSSFCDLSLEANRTYYFGVRAVDEAGAVEPFLDPGRNFFRILSRPSAPVPLVTVSEPSLGIFTFPATAAYPEMASLEGLAYRFSVSCDASSYGGSCGDMRYGLDIADLETDEGWSARMPVGDLPPITLDGPGVHALYIDVRDDLGSHTLAMLVLETVTPAFDREVLWVDDVRDQLNPRDEQHDAFWMSLFDDSGRFGEGSVNVYEVFGDRDLVNREPVPPGLEELLRYEQIVWECKGSGYNGVSALWLDAGFRPLLGQYLRAGGKLWVGGQMTVVAMTPGSATAANFTYPKEMEPGTFAWDFLKLYTGRINNAKGGTTPGSSTDDNMIGVDPFPGRPEIYPAMEQDPAKINPFAGSIPFGDAIFDPIFGQDVATFTGQLDSLYVYKAVKINRTYNNKLNALRWHDPDPDREQGRVQWFGFPLYYMKKEQAQETFNRSIDWFREEPTP